MEIHNFTKPIENQENLFKLLKKVFFSILDDLISDRDHLNSILGDVFENVRSVLRLCLVQDKRMLGADN